MMQMIAMRSRWMAVVVLACAALLSAACGSGGGSSGGGASGSMSPSASTPSATATQSVLCQDVAALRESLARLMHVNVDRGAASELKADVADAQAKVTTLVNHAGDQWSSQISALKSALASLQTAVTGLANGTGSVNAVVHALGGVSTAAQNLFAAANPECPSSSPSPSG